MMLQKRKAAFDAVQPLFQAAEASADRAAADAATCIAEMLRVREEAGLPMSAGTDMLDKLVVALNHNVTARKSFIEAHAMTPALVKEIGLERAFGDIHPCPRTKPSADLTVVPTQAIAA
ncbi:MAG: hypothetical protein ACTHJU_08295 [Sphingopyxis sp.]